MPFAGDQHHVGRRGVQNGLQDGLIALASHLQSAPLRWREALQNLVDDGLRIFHARVVAGQHDVVGALRGGGRHQGALARVAVATAAKHAPQSPAALGRQGPKSSQRFFQGVGCVRVIHHCQRLIALADPFHAARHALQRRASLKRRLKWDAQSAHAAYHRQQIRDIELPGQSGVQWQALRAFGNREVQARRAVLHGTGAQTRLAQRRVGPKINAAASQIGGQFLALGVVDVDHRCHQAGPAEQLGLGLPIGLHAAVIVQMILGEIGEHRNLDQQPVQAPFGQSHRGGFDGAGRAAVDLQRMQALVQQHRIGRGQAAALHVRRASDAQGADHGAGTGSRQRCSAQGLRQPPGGGRFSVRAGDGQHVQLGRGLFEIGRGDGARRLLEAGVAGDAVHRARPKVEGLQALGFDQAGTRPCGQGVAHMRARVNVGAGPGQQAVAGLDGAAVGTEGSGHTLAQPERRLRWRTEQVQGP